MTTFAVTGASGQLGGQAVQALLRRGVAPADVIAVVRDPSKVADLAAAGVQVRTADYGDRNALEAAFVGVDRLLFVSGSEPGKRVAQHANVIAAAEHAGVGLVAYTSIPRADQNPMALATEHRATEELLAGSTVPYALLRNGWYWENYLGGLGHAIESGVLVGAGRDGRIAGAARADYADAGAAVLLADDAHGRVYELGGDQRLTYAELAQVISDVSGRDVHYRDLSAAEYEKVLEQAGMPDGFAQILADSDSVGIVGGYLDVTSGDLQKLNGRPATPFADVVRAALDG